MASSFFLLLDDIASVLDDVAVLTKVATKKTAGVLGDDLALNAQQVAGVEPDRELPVVWAVGKGSLVNKVILVPSALALSFWVPSLIQPLLILGGAFLCFEGAEKLLHKWFHSKEESKEHHKEHLDHLKASPEEIVKLEKDKIKGAIRTDFILSAEIVVITLGSVAEAPFMQKVFTLIAISLAMTFGVYGLVAGIVKIDDAGLALRKMKSQLAQKFGTGLLVTAPILMKTLSVVGTAAMFMVGGGILAHSWPWFHHATQELNVALQIIAELILGLSIGALLATVFMFIQKRRALKSS